MTSDVPTNDGLFSDALNNCEELSPPQAHLNPRSCVTCRKRKVRCDKHEPCGNCVKNHIDCIFPAPGRAPRKARKLPEAELLKRLKRLEGVVQSLGKQVDETDEPVILPERAAPHLGQQSRQSSVSDAAIKTADDPDALPVGKLVISEGKSRYVNNSYWAMIGNEIADIRDILDDQSESEDEDHNSPEAAHEHDQGSKGFVLGFSSLVVDMKRLYPTPSQIFIIWEIFKENIDPVLKVLHCPSVKNLILKAAVNTDNLSRPAEALFFSICFGSIVSMNESQCTSLMGEDKMKLWKNYRFAAEQALARADFLNSSSLMVLQAFVFYLICLRYYDDSKAVWSLGGLATHQAYTQGLHRDGTHFGLDPFETEMRRRLWWHIAALDVRAAEDHGAELRASSSNYDTKFPSNVNDDDIWPGMTTAPVSQKGPTEMTFCLVRFELSAMARRLNFYDPRIQTLGEEDIKEREKLIDECHREIEDKYVRGCNMNIPIFWVAATVSRLILAKIWLKLHHPRLSGKGLHEQPELRDRVFNTSIEVIEFAHLLENNGNTAKWGWLFRTHMQWHAVAYVLSELGARPPSPEVDRAWRAVEAVYEESIHAKRQRGMLWKPIRQLMARARAHQAEGSRKSSQDVQMGQAWLTGQFSVVDAPMSALGMDLESSNSSQFQSPSTNLGLTDFDLPNTTLDPNVVQNTPGSQQDSTPDFLHWDGWSPGVGTFTVGPSAQSFGFDFASTNAKPQEWF